MLHGFADTKRDTGEIGQYKTPGSQGDGDGEFFQDQIDHFLVPVIGFAKVEGKEAHEPGAKLHIHRLVKTVEFLKIRDLLLLDLSPCPLINVRGGASSPTFAATCTGTHLGNHALDGTARHQL